MIKGIVTPLETTIVAQRILIKKRMYGEISFERAFIQSSITPTISMIAAATVNPIETEFQGIKKAMPTKTPRKSGILPPRGILFL